MLEEHLAHPLNTVSLPVLALRLLDDALGVHARELDGDRRIGLFADANLAHTRGPGPAAPQNLLPFFARDRRPDRPVIEGGQTFGIERPERLDLGDESGKQQRLHQPVVVSEGGAFGIIVRQILKFVTPAVLFLKHG